MYWNVRPLEGAHMTHQDLAFQFLVAAADVGHAEAQHNLAIAYGSGLYMSLVPVDLPRHVCVTLFVYDINHCLSYYINHCTSHYNAKPFSYRCYIHLPHLDMLTCVYRSVWLLCVCVQGITITLWCQYILFVRSLVLEYMAALAGNGVMVLMCMW